MLKVILKESNVAAVSGSRMVKKINAIKGKMPLYKFIGNIILSKFFNLLYGTSFTDCHTGYWTYNLKKIDKKCPTTLFCRFWGSIVGVNLG